MKFLAAIIGALALAQDVSGMSMNGQRIKAQKQSDWDKMTQLGMMPRKVESARHMAQTCTGGSVTFNGEEFPCEGIDFEGFLSLTESHIPDFGGTTAGSDIWGWLSPEGKEITLWCVNNGLWFIDSTDPQDVQQLGYMVSGRGKTSWCDVKVYGDTAYVVKDVSSFVGSGIQVFDLNRLVGLEADPSRIFEPDYDYRDNGHEDSHNVIVNADTGFLYSVGTDTCASGLHIASLANPLEPVFEACVSGDGYTHDAQCVVYDGPDTRFTGNEICFAFNEDTLTIWDVTNKQDPKMLARESYDTFDYTHQGWVTDDMKYVIMNDEGDETSNQVETTRTYFVNIQSLTAPFFETEYNHPEVSIDHNLYVWGSIHKRGWGGNPAMEVPPSLKYAYLSNYRAGIKVLDISNLPTVVEVGKFDVAPDAEGNIFSGTWSNYMHPSGVLAVSSIERGLFMLRPQMAFDPVTSAPVPAPVPAPTPGTTSPPSGGDSGAYDTLAFAMAVFAILIVFFAAVYLVCSSTSAKKNEQVSNMKDTL